LPRLKNREDLVSNSRHKAVVHLRDKHKLFVFINAYEQRIEGARSGDVTADDKLLLSIRAVLVIAPGVVPAEAAGSVERNVRDVPNIVSAFKSHLADYYDFPYQVIEAYLTSFYQGGKFVLVRTHPQRDEQAVTILRQCGASRVNRYD
jgi:hypothetical protein